MYKFSLQCLKTLNEKRNYVLDHLNHYCLIWQWPCLPLQSMCVCQLLLLDYWISMVWQMNNHKNSVSCMLYHYFLFFIEFWHENFGGLIFGPGIFLGFRLFTPIWSSLSLYSFTPPLFGGNSIDNFIVFTFNNLWS